jgi:spore maturation protein CgeB
VNELIELQAGRYAQHEAEDKTAEKRNLNMVLKKHEYDDKRPTSSE